MSWDLVFWKRLRPGFDAWHVYDEICEWDEDGPLPGLEPSPDVRRFRDELVRHWPDVADGIVEDADRFVMVTMGLASGGARSDAMIALARSFGLQCLDPQNERLRQDGDDSPRVDAPEPSPPPAGPIGRVVRLASGPSGSRRTRWTPRSALGYGPSGDVESITLSYDDGAITIETAARTAARPSLTDVLIAARPVEQDWFALSLAAHEAGRPAPLIPVVVDGPVGTARIRLVIAGTPYPADCAVRGSLWSARAVVDDVVVTVVVNGFDPVGLELDWTMHH